MKDKILGYGTDSIVCLYCGNKIEVQYEEYESYYECNCADALKRREIEDKISALKRSIPKYKFQIIKKEVLTAVNNNDR